MRKSVQGSLSRSLISKLWLRRGARRDEGRGEGGSTGEGGGGGGRENFRK